MVAAERQGVVLALVLGELVESDVDLAGLRGLQDWYLRYELTAVDGVSEVASAGGFVKQYQVVVDQNQRTTNPRVFAAGDVAGGPQYVYVAAQTGHVAAAGARNNFV